MERKNTNKNTLDREKVSNAVKKELMCIAFLKKEEMVIL